MEHKISSKDSADVTQSFVGVWWLVSREDRAKDGSPRAEPTLGPDPLGILTYANGRFAAQFMKRDRTDVVNIDSSIAGVNNSRAVNGYDAYFGTYAVNDKAGEVEHRLEGALTAENVGIEVSRHLDVIGDKLVIRIETTTMDGEPVTRTLTWERVT